jgi:hypothetical protein
MNKREFKIAVVLALVLEGTVLGIAGLQPSSLQSSSIQQGVSYATYGAGRYSQPDADLSLANLASTGADWIGLIVTGYQDTVSSTTISSTAGTPTDADLIHVITQAHSLGLKVMLKPHVDLSQDPSHWRGQIGTEFTTEAEWSAWFASYRDFIEHYADLAQSYDVDQFCVGTELSGTAHRADDWRAVIAGVRTRYGGPITYAATHGGEDTGIGWWDAVDLIGVDAYYELTDKDDPTLDELRAGWVPHVATVTDLASEWEKPILFTEIGYRSIDGANRDPPDWHREGAIDLQEQADAYQAAFDSVYNQPWFAGMFWWVWGTDPLQGGPCDDDYTPHDKLAEDVLRAWYGAPPRPSPPPSPRPDYSRTMEIYTDGLEAGWQDWSWDATRNLAASDQVYNGARAISVTLGAWGGLSFWHPAFVSTPYHWLEFYVRGSPEGEQYLQAFFHSEDGSELHGERVACSRYIEGGTIDAGAWKRVRIPLSRLNVAERSVVRVSIQDRRGQPSTAFWVDEMRLVGAAWSVYLPLVISGPTAGVVKTPYTFTATVGPVTATQPLTYAWQATDLGTVMHTGGDLDDSATFTWTTPGPKVITVTTSNAAGTVSATHGITLGVSPVPPICVGISGLAVGVAGILYIFTATVSPSTTTQPIAYAWQATGLAPITHTHGEMDDTATFAWTMLGPKVITVVASNAAGSVASMPYTITIGGTTGNKVYLPIVLKQFWECR